MATPPIIVVRSITATCLRALAAAIAAFWPAGPLPITILPQQPQRRFFHSLKKWMANGTWKGWLATAHQDCGIQTDGIRACALKSHWAGPENSARQSEGKVMNARVAVQEQPRFDEISEWVEAFDQVLAAKSGHSWGMARLTNPNRWGH